MSASPTNPQVEPAQKIGDANAAGGLTSAEAAQRLMKDGPNEPAPARRLSAIVQIFDLFANPLVIILLVASAISAFLGQRIDALIIVTIVLLSVSINFSQSYRSQRAAERLRASVTPTATVLRDGNWQEVSIKEVVRDDVVKLAAGDLVPADARLLESRDLSVQQSMLTGESLPVDKFAVAQQTGTGPDAPNLVFLGTSAVSGTGIALVLATGPRTMFGDIALRLRSRTPETEFEQGLRRFSLLILRTTVALVLFILLVSIALKRDPFESLLFAVALGVGLTPEFLPMISTVTLTQGALRMARQKVIVKHLPAIQDLGSIDVLCSDKTGTITAGVMQLTESLDPAGAASQRAIELAYLNSRFETGIRSPLDAAIVEKPGPEISGYEKVDEMPFDFERRRLSVVLKMPEKQQYLLISKGAAESIIAACTQLEVGGETKPLDVNAKAACAKVANGLGDEGLRVLAVAYRWIDIRKEYARDDESNMVLAGFLGFADPLIEGVSDVIAQMDRDGVTVKILTGDNAGVAVHVCRLAGLGQREVITGEEIAALDDGALGHVVEEKGVFARVSPAQKNRIILALKRRGHVVGYIGDGINDAPSLHSADVGISVMSATDVARETADIILGERSLSVLHGGILEGRRASGNMLKYLLMGTSSNFGNMFSMAAASVFLPFLPMLPTQILLNNFLYDAAQITIPSDNVDEAFLRRPQRLNVNLIRDFMLYIGPISSIFDFLTFYVLLAFFHADERLFHTGWFLESLATQTLVLFVIRTMGNPLRSRPSPSLAFTVLLTVVIGVALPFTPLAGVLGFVSPPPSYLAFMLGATFVYLALVNVAKTWLMRRLTPVALAPA